MIDLTKKSKDAEYLANLKLSMHFTPYARLSYKLEVLDRLRVMNNPLMLYQLDSTGVSILRDWLDPYRFKDIYPVKTLGSPELKNGIDIYSGELIAAENATKAQLCDNLIVSYIFPVVRLFATAINRMTPAIRNEIITPGDTSWAEMKLLVERWDDHPTISRLIDAGVIRPISGYYNRALSTPEDCEKAFTSQLHPEMSADQKDVVRFSVLIKCLREMGVGRCAALAEKYQPEVIDSLRKLDNDITGFFRNRS